MSKILELELIEVKIEKGTSGLFFISSSDIDGLLIGRPSIDALVNDIPQTIKDLRAVTNEITGETVEEIEVFHLPRKTKGNLHYFIIVPKKLLKDKARCGCWRCYQERGEATNHMILCPSCGNKRCPKASDHRLDCTGSNEPGQPGSVYS